MFPDLTRDDVFRIETRRLWLRWPVARDADAIVALAGERAVAEMTARIPHPIERVQVDAFVIAARRGNAEGAGLTMALAPRSAPAALVGIVSIEPDGQADGPHLGYWLGRPHWGSGLATEAAAAMIDAFFRYAGGAVLTSDILAGNAASGRVLEKCGFVQDGSCRRSFPARGDDRPVQTFRLERAAWRARGRCDFEEAMA